MNESHPSPFPTALVLDASFQRTIGETGTDAYETFVRYVRTEDRELFLSSDVVEELTEQRGYISIDWMDRVHERLAVFEQPGPDELRKADSELPAVGVYLIPS